MNAFGFETGDFVLDRHPEAKARPVPILPLEALLERCPDHAFLRTRNFCGRNRFTASRNSLAWREIHCSVPYGFDLNGRRTVLEQPHEASTENWNEDRKTCQSTLDGLRRGPGIHRCNSVVGMISAAASAHDLLSSAHDLL
jgi:hypothetical protein